MMGSQRCLNPIIEQASTHSQVSNVIVKPSVAPPIHKTLQTTYIQQTFMRALVCVCETAHRFCRMRKLNAVETWRWTRCPLRVLYNFGKYSAPCKRSVLLNYIMSNFCNIYVKDISYGKIYLQYIGSFTLERLLNVYRMKRVLTSVVVWYRHRLVHMWSATNSLYRSVHLWTPNINWRCVVTSGRIKRQNIFR